MDHVINVEDNYLLPTTVRLRDFLKSFDLSKLIEEVQKNTRLSEVDANELIRTHANEAYSSLALFEDINLQNCRVLEVGSGLGFFSLFLKHCGVNIVSLEPSINGFSVFSKCRHIIIHRSKISDLEQLDIPAENITPELAGAYSGPLGSPFLAGWDR
ncbi:MAG: hypothetical protein ACFHVJ_20075 [Aestuariibacter sp.]